MHPLTLKARAVKLRKTGKTYSDIKKILRRNLPKSTLSVWFKNIVLSESNSKRLEENIAKKLSKAQREGRRILNKKRAIFLDKLRRKNLHLLKLINLPQTKMLLSILYLAEGAKHKSTPFLSLGSSSPHIIRFFMASLRKCFEIENSKFRIRIQCRADQNIKSLENFWHRITEIDLKQFYPTYIDQRTIGKKTTKKDYRGVCVIHYFDTSIQLELEFLANSVVEYIIGARSSSG